MASPYYFLLTVLVLASTQSSFAELVPNAKTNYYILEPHILELTCTFKNVTGVQWYKDSVSLTNAAGFVQSSNPAGLETNYNLTKTNTTHKDAGKYKCVGGSDSQTFTVEVFKVIPHSAVVVSKEPAIIKCDLQHLDAGKVTKFYWTKNYTVLGDVSEIQGRYNVYEANYTLEIPKAKRRDNGLYQCVFKIDDKDFSIDVPMNMAPWIESMEKSRNLVQGDKLHLECNVQSHPFATVHWKKDNETFKGEVRRIFLKDNRTLIIFDLQFSDKGEYTCVATNNVNSTSMTVLVRVKDKLAALWPFLGIVAEVVILCIIIFICEKRRSKEMEDEYENAGPQAIPNAKDHKGKDEIRQRNVRT